MFVELKDLGEQLKCIKNALARQKGTLKGSLSIGMIEHYRSWRAWRLGLPAFQPSLATLLAYFSHCGCQHKRDRIFALSAFLEDQSFFDIDYGTDRATLFQNMMDGYMTNKPVDEVLHFGAILIQALEVRRPSQVSESSDLCAEPLPLSATGHSPLSTSAPVWATNYLEVQTNPDDDIFPHLHQSYSQKPMLCIYVGIRDGPDFHVFEYAVEESDVGVSVKYARAHEYMQGSPPTRRGMTSDNDALWIDLPSEDVYYFRGPFDEHYQDSIPDLRNWTSPDMEIVKDLCADRKEVQTVCSKTPLRQRMKQSKRSWTVLRLWSLDEKSIEAQIFMSARRNIETAIGKPRAALPAPRAVGTISVSAFLLHNQRYPHLMGTGYDSLAQYDYDHDPGRLPDQMSRNWRY